MAGKEGLEGGAAPPSALGHDLGLFGQGGPFEHYPGPVLVVGFTRTVITGNRAAQPLAEALRLSRVPDLMEAVGVALSGIPTALTLALPDRPSEAEGKAVLAGEAPVFDFDVLPWAEGAAALVLGREVTLERVQREALRRELARCRHHEAVSGRLLRLLRLLLPPREWPPSLLRSLPDLLELSGLHLLSRAASDFVTVGGVGERPGPRGRRLIARLLETTPEQTSWEEEGDHCCLLPLLLRKRLTGALFCRRGKEAGPFDAAEIAFLAAVGSELAGAFAYGEFQGPRFTRA